MKIPKLIKIKQHFKNEKLEDIEKSVKNEVRSLNLQIEPGAEIAIAVGSRGIANLPIIVKSVVDSVKSMGGVPFIVPAMGSHGGATPQGQKEVLESYGIKETYVGASIRSSLDVVELPNDGLKNKVYMDKYAYNSDGTIVINRIKVHTDFRGPTESGLMKMLVIGLGKHKQALAIHHYRIYGLKELIRPTARQILKYGNIIIGLGIVENECDETYLVRAIKPQEIEQEEIKLMEIARNHMPSLPVEQLDVLIVDQIGKDISGSGMDTNIIGRMRIDTEEEPVRPKITNIIAADLTKDTNGNACGMGLADIITEKLKSKIDFKVTYENIVTGTFLLRGFMPIVAETDREALVYGLTTCGPIEPEDARIIRIKDTLHLEEMYVSKAVIDEISENSNVEVVGDYQEVLDDREQLIQF
jgi:hypothetical protein